MDNMDEIYSSVVNLTKVESYKKENLKKLLTLNPGKFFTATELAKLCEFPNKGTHVELRRSITELLEEEGCAIVSNIKGYTFVDVKTDSGKNMIRFCLNGLRQRAQGLDRRIKTYEEML